MGDRQLRLKLACRGDAEEEMAPLMKVLGIFRIEDEASGVGGAMIQIGRKTDAC